MHVDGVWVTCACIQGTDFVVVRGSLGRKGLGKWCSLWRCADFALMWNVWPEEKSTLFKGKEEDVELLWDMIYF